MVMGSLSISDVLLVRNLEEWHGFEGVSPPVQQASCRLAVKEGHGQVHDPCQQVPVQLLAGAEAAQHQQQRPDDLQEQPGGG